MRNRYAHIWRAELRDHRTVPKLDEPMNDGLRVHEHIKLVGSEREQVMGFDQFETLVHQRCRIDGYFRSHRPARMFERLLDRDFADGVGRPGAEWAAGGREHDAPDVLAAAGAERLEY